jgi:hypothetical protein
VLDPLQDNRLSGAVDTADGTPVAVANPHPVLVAAQCPSRRMCREGVDGEGLDARE